MKDGRQDKIGRVVLSVKERNETECLKENLNSSRNHIN